VPAIYQEPATAYMRRCRAGSFPFQPVRGNGRAFFALFQFGRQSGFTWRAVRLVVVAAVAAWFLACRGSTLDDDRGLQRLDSLMS
jgi:hypothetical protein